MSDSVGEQADPTGASETPGQGPAPTGGMRSCVTLVSVILAIPPYLLSIPIMFEIGTGDSHSRALTPFFAILFQLVMWVLLGLFMVMRVAPAKLPGRAFLLATFLVLGGVAGSTVGIGMMTEPDLLVLPPILLPALALFFAIWAPQQAWPEAKARNPVLIGLAVAAALLVAAPFAAYAKWVADAPEREAEWARLQAEQEREAAAQAAAEEARFRALGPGSRLDDVLPFLDSSTRYQEAMAMIPTLESRQADATRLLAGRADLSPLLTLSEFGLDPAEPGLCRAFAGRIDAEIQESARPGANQEWMAMGLESHLPNMRWFVDGGCDLSGPIGNLRAALRRQPDYIDTRPFDEQLAALSRPAAASAPAPQS